MNENIKDAQKDIFSKLYYLKTYILMAETIVGQSAVSKCINYKPLDIERKYTDNYIFTFIKQAQNDVLLLIPKDVFEYYKYSDYETYTDKYYHNLFFNQIENDDIVENILDIITNRFNLNYDDKKSFVLSLYDFNNASIYFNTETDMNNFFDNYDIAPCTAYKAVPCTTSKHNNSHTAKEYIELWSS